MTSPTNFYHVIQIVLWMWSCDQSLVNVAFLWETFNNLNFIRIWSEKRFILREGSWFVLNNLGLALGTNLTLYTSVEKALKLKVRKFLELNPTFVEVTGEELVGGMRAFLALILNKVKKLSFCRGGNLFFKKSISKWNSTLKNKKILSSLKKVFAFKRKT